MARDQWRACGAPRRSPVLGPAGGVAEAAGAPPSAGRDVGGADPDASGDAGPEALDGQRFHVQVPEGLELILVTNGLNFPTGITVDEQTGHLWIADSGIPPAPEVRILELHPTGEENEILSNGDLETGQLLPPLTDVIFHDGWLWISHRQFDANLNPDNELGETTRFNAWAVGAISRFHPDDPLGTFETVISNLPSAGDFTTTELVFDEEGRLYFWVFTIEETYTDKLMDLLLTSEAGTLPVLGVRSFVPWSRRTKQLA